VRASLTRAVSTEGCRYQRVALSDGWSALVLRECHVMAQDQGVPPELPSERDWRAFLDQVVRKASELDDYALLKYSDNGEVLSARWTWSSGTMPIIAKRSRTHGFRQSIAAMLRPTRARRNFIRASHLLHDGIDTALPFALVERGGVAREAWLVSVFVNNLIDLDQIVMTWLPRADARSVRHIKDRLIERVALLFSRLQQAGWYHRDLKASNIMLTNWDRDDARVWLVDLDGLRCGRRHHQIDLRPVVRLAASLRPYRSVSTTDGVRFVKKMIESLGKDSPGWRKVLRTVATRAVAYNRRAQGRKAGKLDGFDGAM